MQPIKYIHMADTHLGFQQYNLPERKKDFNRAFNWVLNKSIKEEVDFILLAGDVFNTNRSDPETMAAIYQMITQFNLNSKEKLNREIPIIAIEGNHDKSNYFAKRSWLKFLAELKLIILLNPKYDNEKKNFDFVPYSENKKRHGMIRIKDTCIYGVPFYGAMTKNFFPTIYESLPENSETFNILMMHFGISGQVRDKPGIEMSEDLNLLHDKIDYLALGHFHKKFALPKNNEWIFNPGSLEVNDAKEVWGIRGEPYRRGVFLVEVIDQDNPNIKHIPCANGRSESSDEIPNRFFSDHYVEIGTSNLKSFKETILYILNYLTPHFEEKLNSNLKKNDLDLPIVLLTLAGTISYSKLEVNINELKEKIMEKFDVLDVHIFSGKLSSTIDGLYVDSDSEKSFEEIENEVFSLLIQQNPDYEPFTNEIVQLMLDLKSPLLDSKPEYNQLKEQIKSWWRANITDDTIGELSNNPITNENLQETREESVEEAAEIEDELDNMDLLDDGLDD
ncbi:MAG: metallophosphoesterase family protein [Promethearchaeota archaeon]